MDAKEEGILLGELKGFKDSMTRQVDSIALDISGMRTQIAALNQFKWKVTGIMATLTVLVNAGFHVAKLYFEHKK